MEAFGKGRAVRAGLMDGCQVGRAGVKASWFRNSFAEPKFGTEGQKEKLGEGRGCLVPSQVMLS